MVKEIIIMDYDNKKTKVIIDNFENVVKLNIEVITGNEILNVLYKDYSNKTYDSSDCRLSNFYDNEYCIYDIINKIDYIDSWNKRKSSYEYELKELEK